ncbi:MAG: HU family DNA-binding protein [Candidatus Auribacterota bacterium]|nr:HU family DNA-binding protein [Candidatus Auribacterota bacterium]
MNKVELIRVVHNEAKEIKFRITIAEIEGIINATLDNVVKGLIEDKIVSYAGYGKITMKTMPERVGRNPQTGEEITIKPKNKLNFKVFSNVIDRINETNETNE